MVTLKVKRLLTHPQKIIGLIGAKRIYPVFFTTRWGIHTFGVLSPIDVLILDGNNKVVNLRGGLLPNRLYFWNPRFNQVIELPPGIVAEKGITISTQIKLEE